MELDISIKSSSRPEPYAVSFHLDGGMVSAKCSCPAGVHSRLCKHVIWSVAGNEEAAFEERDKAKLATVRKCLEGTELVGLVSQWTEADQEARDAKKVADRLKGKIKKSLNLGR